MPLFTFPIALAALAALPTLAAIYWLRNRFRQHPVSSLMLWAEHKQPREGGSRLQNIQTPLLFFLELLALTLLALASAGPFLNLMRSSPPLLVILDDSYSMQAGGDVSARTLADDLLSDVLGERWDLSVQFILASDHPQLLGGNATTMTQATDLLKQWQPEAETADLNKAIAMAAQIGGPDAQILVITDHEPDQTIAPGPIVWHALGRALPNVAITNAVRSPYDDEERCLLELTNLSAGPVTTTLTIRASSTQSSEITLQPNQPHRMTFDLPPDSPAVAVSISDDALMIDNHVTLLPSTTPDLRVSLQVGNERLRNILSSALKATDRVNLTTENPQLLITDNSAARPSGLDTWCVYCMIDAEPTSFLGPFVFNRLHPLTQGVSLDSVVWAAGSSGDMPGDPVIMAGNTPLLSDVTLPTGRHELRLRYNPDFSSLHQRPDWPILIYNLVQWRMAARPGVDVPNARLGGTVRCTLPFNLGSIELTDPRGMVTKLSPTSSSLAFPAAIVGQYELAVSEDVTYRFAVNALSLDESNMAAAATGQYGSWLTPETIQRQYQPVAWMFLLGALGLLAAHTFLIARASGGPHL